MMVELIGSRALVHWLERLSDPLDALNIFQDFHQEDRMDYDFLINRCDKKEFIETMGDYSFLKEFNHGLMMKLKTGEKIEAFYHDDVTEGFEQEGTDRIILEKDSVFTKFKGHHLWIGSPLLLYIIKKSHATLPFKIGKFEKHCADIFLLYNFLGIKEIVECEEDYFMSVFNERQQFMEEVRELKRKTRPVMGDKKSFFTDKVDRFFDHDFLHTLVCYEEEPVYKRYLVDPEGVKCSWNKFEQLCDTRRLNAILEEAYVIALERYLIPSIQRKQLRTTDECFRMALKDLGTRLWKGKWAHFVVDNWYECMSKYDHNYWVLPVGMMETYARA